MESRQRVTALMRAWRTDETLRRRFGAERGALAKRRLLAEHGLLVSEQDFAEMMSLIRRLARAEAAAEPPRVAVFDHYQAGDWQALLARLRSLSGEPCP